MTTFLQDMALKGYNQDAVHAILYESDKDSKRREMRMNVTETVNAHRLEEMKSVLMKVELAAWRRMNGFDRDEVLARDGRPLTPEEYTTFFNDEVDELRDAIFLTERERDRKRMERFMRKLMRGRIIMQVTDDEHDAIKQYAKERAERAHGTPQSAPSTVHVQHCNSPSPETTSNPDPPSDAYVILEDGKSEEVMSPTLDDNKQQSSLADTGIEAPEQQSTPQGGMWEAGMINAGGSLYADVINYSPNQLTREATLALAFNSMKTATSLLFLV